MQTSLFDKAVKRTGVSSNRYTIINDQSEQERVDWEWIIGNQMGEKPPKGKAEKS